MFVRRQSREVIMELFPPSLCSVVLLIMKLCTFLELWCSRQRGCSEHCKKSFLLAVPANLSPPCC